MSSKAQRRAERKDTRYQMRQATLEYSRRQPKSTADMPGLAEVELRVVAACKRNHGGTSEVSADCRICSRRQLCKEVCLTAQPEVDMMLEESEALCRSADEILAELGASVGCDDYPMVDTCQGDTCRLTGFDAVGERPRHPELSEFDEQNRQLALEEGLDDQVRHM